MSEDSEGLSRPRRARAFPARLAASAAPTPGSTGRVLSGGVRVGRRENDEAR
jgi:hypothetical protein